MRATGVRVLGAAATGCQAQNSSRSSPSLLRLKESRRRRIARYLSLMTSAGGGTSDRISARRRSRSKEPRVRQTSALLDRRTRGRPTRSSVPEVVLDVEVVGVVRALVPAAPGIPEDRVNTQRAAWLARGLGGIASSDDRSCLIFEEPAGDGEAIGCPAGDPALEVVSRGPLELDVHRREPAPVEGHAAGRQRGGIAAGVGEDPSVAKSRTGGDTTGRATNRETRSQRPLSTSRVFPGRAAPARSKPAPARRAV